LAFDCSVPDTTLPVRGDADALAQIIVNLLLDQVIVQLRKKLGDNSGEPRLLLTIHGVGYKMAA
jgi:DNA-binding response OmpR family regulator